MTLEEAIIRQLWIGGSVSAARVARAVADGPAGVLQSPARQLKAVGNLLHQFRREGLVTSRPGTGLWELTPAGFQRAQDEAEARLMGAK